MINSYNAINRNFLFQKQCGLKEQHIKIFEEVEEVRDEVIVCEEGLYIKNSVADYVNELLDLRMAINNQLIRIGNEYGETSLKRYCAEWDNKMINYREHKYKGDDE